MKPFNIFLCFYTIILLDTVNSAHFERKEIITTKSFDGPYGQQIVIAKEYINDPKVSSVESLRKDFNNDRLHQQQNNNKRFARRYFGDDPTIIQIYELLRRHNGDDKPPNAEESHRKYDIESYNNGELYGSYDNKDVLRKFSNYQLATHINDNLDELLENHGETKSLDGPLSKHAESELPRKFHEDEIYKEQNRNDVLPTNINNINIRNTKSNKQLRKYGDEDQLPNGWFYAITGRRNPMTVSCDYAAFIVNMDSYNACAVYCIGQYNRQSSGGVCWHRDCICRVAGDGDYDPETWEKSFG